MSVTVTLVLDGIENSFGSNLISSNLTVTSLPVGDGDPLGDASGDASGDAASVGEAAGVTTTGGTTSVGEAAMVGEASGEVTGGGTISVGEASGDVTGGGTTSVGDASGDAAGEVTGGMTSVGEASGEATGDAAGDSASVGSISGDSAAAAVGVFTAGGGVGVLSALSSPPHAASKTDPMASMATMVNHLRPALNPPSMTGFFLTISLRFFETEARSAHITRAQEDEREKLAHHTRQTAHSTTLYASKMSHYSR